MTSSLPSEEPEIRPAVRRTPPSRRKRRRNIMLPVGVLTLVVAAVAFAVWAARGPQAAQAKYSTAEVTQDTLVVSASASGNLYVKKEKSVQPQVSGTVEDLKVKLGQRVKAGQVLYTISNDDLDTSVTKARGSLRQAQQSLERAKISLLQAEQQLDKLESVTGTMAPSEDDIEIAERQVDVAEMGVSAAEDDVTAARRSYNSAVEDAGGRVVTAPIGGIITALTLEEGESAGSSSSSGSSGSSSSSAASAMGGISSTGSSSSSGTSGSLVISDFSSMRASVQVNEADLPSVKVGQKATLSFDAIDGLQLKGKVVQVAPVGTNSSGVVTYDVDILPTSLDARLKPNMSVSAAITTKVRQDAILVPNAAVKSDTNGTYVQIVGADGEAQQVDVTAGASNDSYTEITEGLTVGQSVVTATLSGSTGSGAAGGAGGNRGGFMMGGAMGGGTRVVR